jgi:hypothetical protein
MITGMCMTCAILEKRGVDGALDLGKFAGSVWSTWDGRPKLQVVRESACSGKLWETFIDPVDQRSPYLLLGLFFQKCYRRRHMKGGKGCVSLFKRHGVNQESQNLWALFSIQENIQMHPDFENNHMMLVFEHTTRIH